MEVNTNERMVIIEEILRIKEKKFKNKKLNEKIMKIMKIKSKVDFLEI